LKVQESNAIRISITATTKIAKPRKYPVTPMSLDNMPLAEGIERTIRTSKRTTRNSNIF
tara:strand:+ start:752 stop:928 length:177 start_codon:yes stop_codon:yes gene_type:complete